MDHHVALGGSEVYRGGTTVKRVYDSDPARTVANAKGCRGVMDYYKEVPKNKFAHLWVLNSFKEFENRLIHIMRSFMHGI